LVCCQQFSLWLCRIATPALAGGARESGRKNPDLAIRVKHKEENSFIFRIAGRFFGLIKKKRKKGGHAAHAHPFFGIYKNQTRKATLLVP
jgi:hypothetical protein